MKKYRAIKIFLAAVLSFSCFSCLEKTVYAEENSNTYHIYVNKDEIDFFENYFKQDESGEHYGFY